MKVELLNDGPFTILLEFRPACHRMAESVPTTDVSVENLLESW